MAEPPQPSGTVTLVFTDIEGSTRLLDELGVDAYRDVLAEHRRVVRHACARHHGYEVDFEGDAFFYAFATAQTAVSAVSEAMQGLDGGPIRIRVGIHTGEPALDPPKYVGIDVHRAARIMSAAHGGQVVLSPSTVVLLEPGSVELKELGQHRLKDLSAPIPLHQLLTGGISEFPPLKTLYRSNLPVPATPFLGRANELAEVVRRLLDPDTRLLTLTGPGGTGKTRLALQAAAEAADHYPDGISWAALAPVSDPELLVPTVARSLGIREVPGHPLADVVSAALRERTALLVLDNLEQLLPDAALIVGALVDACPRLRVVVTSRERLRIGAETVWPVPPLSPADAGHLFVERARAGGVELAIDETVGELCRRLDELPLAIELAAARTSVFAPGQLLDRLGQRLDLLQAGRDAEARQHTLRATIDWSYDLLDADEQRVYRALSVFAGGCTFEAAEQVVDANPDLLQSLLDKSLLRRRETRDEPRYWMLETIREHSADKLDEHSESNAVRMEHVRWMAAFAARAATGMRGGADQPTWFERVGLERDNIHVAIRSGFALDVPETAEILPGVALWWDVTSPEEAGGLCEIALEHRLPPEARGVTLAWASLFALRVGDMARATVLAEDGVATARMSGDIWAEAWSLNTLGNIASSTGRMAESARIYRRVLELAEHSGEPWLRDAVGVNLAAVSAFVDVGLPGDALRAIEDSARRRGDTYLVSIISGNRCFVALTDGRWDDAERQARESIALSAAFGGAFSAFDQTNHAHALLRLGRVDEASEVARDVVASAIDSSDDLAVKLPLLVVAAGLLLELGDRETAATLLGAETEIAQSSGWVLEGGDHDLAADVRDILTSALGREFSPVFHRGAALSLAEALRIALAAFERLRVPTAPPQAAPEPAGD